MKTPLLFCLLSALLDTGTCVSCEVCFSARDSCTGSKQVCSERMDSCGIIKTETVVGEIKSPTFMKACVTSSQCGLSTLFMTFGNGISVSTNIACCVGQACKTASVTVPRANTTLNGLHCPACYSVFTHHCSEEIIDCTGAQTQCVHISGTVKSGGTTVHTTMKGCATESACTNIQRFKGAFAGFSADLPTAECRPASRVASMAPEPARLVLPALITVLLANVLS
ncbi:phospholipase A2 inhibitor gamma subunit B-like [Malaclemys terrapin pileata]|uniref:phospholipase A2 inhibitor gamma subunit B-like n=1 Tax=Malaclemys terrapin pileata TaxID=2991368 RepID=UPI0023A85B4B|nr:phospholipase A2 inhibitor gamma subunit B-like [Malaclemys terrapin pileata]